MSNMKGKISSRLQRFRTSISQKRRAAHLALILLAITTASCSISNHKTSTHEIKRVPSNVVKILNRASCLGSKFECSQIKADTVWKVCLKNGYQERNPVGEVASSRSIREVFAETMIETTRGSKQIEKIDQNGVVNIVEVPEERQDSKPVSAECVGSEYITK